MPTEDKEKLNKKWVKLKQKYRKKTSKNGKKRETIG